MANSWSQGTYDIQNPEKYIGNKKPVYRSSWEKRFFYYCDMKEDVLKWGSEVLVLPYYFPRDKKYHKYYTDVFMVVKTKMGNIEKYVIEIKPEKQTKKPKPPKRRTKKSIQNYKNSLVMYEKNVAKWKATSVYCKNRGLKFKIITEKEIF